MTLASQSARGVQAQRMMTRRAKLSRGSKRRLLTASVLCLVLAAVGVIVLWQTRVFGGAAGPASAAASDGNPATLPADPLAGTRGQTDRAATPPPPSLSAERRSTAAAGLAGAETAPPTLEMGGRRSSAGAAAQPSQPARETPPAADPPAPARTPAPDAANPPPAAPAATNSPGELSSPVQGVLASAERAASQGRLVEARDLYTQVILDDAASSRQQQEAREKASAINDKLVFSRHIEPNDPLVETYTVEKNDNLTRIAHKIGLSAEPMFIARINGMANPNRLGLGQKLKIVRGPFHAVVDKSDYRMDIFVGERPVPGGGKPRWTYVRSFRVGLGEGGSTPLGLFAVRENSKLINPHWVNPRTGEKFDRDNPANPIGERWIGLEGLEAGNTAAAGYGIHGTIQPESIGQEMSMGCIRMAAPDVETVYDMLMPTVSTVRIQP